MTKCEQAQKGVDELLEKLQQLMKQATATNNKLADKPDKSLSIQIRVTLVQIIRCIIHYATHMGGFKDPVEPLKRISYREDVESIELAEDEKAGDEKRADEELEVLGSIGFKNAKEPYFNYPTAIGKIDQMCKDLCSKLYTGENTSYLVGPEKIPEYLTIFLEKMKRQAEEFKINQVRQLRTATQMFKELCCQVPYAVYEYLRIVYSSKIEQLLGNIELKFDTFKANDDKQKEVHLRLFRPNLENPSNKQMTAELNTKEL